MYNTPFRVKKIVHNSITCINPNKVGDHRIILLTPKQLIYTYGGYNGAPKSSLMTPSCKTLSFLMGNKSYGHKYLILNEVVRVIDSVY